MKNYLILHNIRSVINVGAIFRTADGCGIDKIYLTGYTPAPKDRFGKNRNDFKKASLGAENFVQWEKSEDEHELINNLKKDGFKIISIEQDKRSLDYKNITPTQKNVFIFGNENTGIDRDILDISDEIAEISMKGNKESLNVSTTAGISLFRILNI